MGRPPRLHAPNGIYFARLPVNSGQALIRDTQAVSCDEQGAQLNRVVAKALVASDAELFAYCWLEAEALLLLKIAQVPVGRVVHSVAGPYASWLHRRLGHSGALFGRHHAVLLQSKRFVREAVRYIHQRPLRDGSVTDIDGYLWSSHQNYVGSVKQSWVTTTTVCPLITRQYGPAASAYRTWVQQRISDEDAQFFESSARRLPVSGADVRPLLGSEDAHERLDSRMTKVPEELLTEIVDAVCEKLGIDSKELRESPSSRSPLVGAARALVAWHARRYGISLQQVEGVTGRTYSALIAAIERYRARRADLFREPLLPDGVSASPSIRARGIARA